MKRLALILVSMMTIMVLINGGPKHHQPKPVPSVSLPALDLSLEYHRPVYHKPRPKPVHTNTPVPQPAPSYHYHQGPVNWEAIHECESSDWYYNGPSGFDGGLQFAPSTWDSLGMGYAYAWQAPPAVQIAGAEKLLARVGGRGWTQWPVCWWRQ